MSTVDVPEGLAPAGTVFRAGPPQQMTIQMMYSEHLVVLVLYVLLILGA